MKLHLNEFILTNYLYHYDLLLLSQQIKIIINFSIKVNPWSYDFCPLKVNHFANNPHASNFANILCFNFIVIVSYQVVIIIIEFYCIMSFTYFFSYFNFNHYVKIKVVVLKSILDFINLFDYNLQINNNFPNSLIKSDYDHYHQNCDHCNHFS